MEDIMAKKKRTIPQVVRDQINLYWIKDPVHAAKQAACWLMDADGTFERDQNAVVDYNLAIGALAEKMREGSAEAFIKAVEDEVANR
jgi:hypothetical protein